MKKIRKILSIALVLCLALGLMPCLTVSADAADETGYPYYVITKGEDGTGNYHVYKADSAGSFAAFTASADDKSQGCDNFRTVY
mgnify:CR=1 FL=1